VGTVVHGPGRAGQNRTGKPRGAQLTEHALGYPHLAGREIDSEARAAGRWQVKPGNHDRRVRALDRVKNKVTGLRKSRDAVMLATEVLGDSELRRAEQSGPGLCV